MRVLSWALVALTPSLCLAADLSPASLKLHAAQIAPSLIKLRHEFHMYPELSLEEFNTSARIRRELDALGIPHFTPESLPTAVIGYLNEDHAGPVVALRADIDALPIQEQLSLDYASVHPGKMHACGHDVHMTMLLGAARLLKAHERALPGRVMLVFQPAEEGKGGAKRLIETGALDSIRAMVGQHVWPELPLGTFGVREGVIMAASDRFVIVVKGRGGHGALPHLSVDPVLVASSIVTSAQALVSRETSPLSSAVLSITRFNTGPGAPNVIPDSVELQGTIRALSHELRMELRDRLLAVVRHVTSMYRANFTDEWSPVPYPETRNDPQLTRVSLDVARSIFPRVVELPEPSMAAEDFSFYARSLRIPTLFAFTGVGGTAGLHHPQFLVDDGVLADGAAFLAAMATETMDRLVTNNSESSSLSREEL